MADSVRSLDEARRQFATHQVMLRTSQALELGIHPRTLYRLRDSGEIVRIGRGLYRLATAHPLTNPDWISVALKVPRAVVCLISALAYHKLTLHVPHSIDIALPSDAQVPKVDDLPVRVFWFSEPAFSAGVDQVNIDSVSVRMYSAEKTIADCFRYRNKIGLDIAVDALREYRQRIKKPNMKALLKFVEIVRVARIMRPYLDALL